MCDVSRAYAILGRGAGMLTLDATLTKEIDCYALKSTTSLNVKAQLPVTILDQSQLLCKPVTAEEAVHNA
eukprot:10640-Heterococcus_DN1.PRE.2